MTGTSYLKDIFARNASRELFFDVRLDQSTTYGELYDQSRRTASVLRSLGVNRGDATAVSVENGVEAAWLYFGCMHLGARFVPINPALHAGDILAILKLSGASAMLTTPKIRERFSDGQLPVPVHCFAQAAERLKDRHRQLLTMDLRAEIAARDPFSESELADFPDETVFMTMYSSGTTGLPKGVNISYKGILNNGRVFAEALGLNNESRFYNVLPMTYLGGAYNLMLIPILAEGSIVLDGVFGVPNVYGFWETVRDRNVNTLWFSPTMLSMLLRLEDEMDMSFLHSQVRCGIVGMAPLSPELKQRFEERFGVPLYENYGLSETTFLTTQRPGRPRLAGSVGTCLKGVEIRLLDPAHQPAPPTREGNIAIRTEYFMRGYSNDENSSSFLPEGWFLTGDRGLFDDAGELHITGRTKDIIIRGGINVSPKRIEDVLYELPAVSEAAVVGIPDEVYGEEIVAAVVLNPSGEDPLDEETILEHCKSRIAHFQTPKRVFVFEALPRGATGKLQKTMIRQNVLERMK